MLAARVIECEKYLGLPMTEGKSKVNTFKDLQEKITERILGWKEKFILKERREILIKIVAQAIPTYSKSIFKSLSASINSTLAKYWWRQKWTEKKLHWINWNKLCSKKDRGRMVFRGLYVFNLVMLAK